jgi:hypothetical protein
VRALFSKVTLDDLFRPALWKQLNFYALIVPEGDILPVRSVYDSKSGTCNIGLNALHWKQPMWIAGPDLIASVLLSGHIPNIKEAFRIVPDAKQHDLKPIALRGAISVDPTKEDFFTRVIEYRKQNKANNRLQYFLKILANSTSYGTYLELNPVKIDPSDRPKNLWKRSSAVDAHQLEFLTTLVQYPEETATAEYKSAIAFDPTTDFGGKLIKHILGLANAGGGYIVIGFREEASGKLATDPGMNGSVCGLYETTRLSQSVDSYLASGQRIELKVHKIEANSTTYPVISIQGFAESPLFCGRDFKGRDGKMILKEGAIYIRDVAAKTVIIAGPNEFRTLLQVAVRRRQGEVLNQFRSLLSEMGLSLPSGVARSINAESEKKFQEWSQEQRAQALREMAKVWKQK